jgi:hypothetical protein
MHQGVQITQKPGGLNGSRLFGWRTPREEHNRAAETDGVGPKHEEPSYERSVNQAGLLIVGLERHHIN